MVNNGSASEYSTINILSNIDLEGVEWTPIGMPTNNAPIFFRGTLNGNGYTIKNFTANSGKYAGFIGRAAGNATVKDLNIENATIISDNDGEAMAGGIIAEYQGGDPTGLVTNCSVKNSTIYANNYKTENSSKAGGIVGYVVKENQPNAGIVVDNCTVENVSVTGGAKDYGNGLVCTGEVVGYLGMGSLGNNTVTNVTVETIK